MSVDGGPARAPFIADFNHRRESEESARGEPRRAFANEDSGRTKDSIYNVECCFAEEDTMAPTMKSLGIDRMSADQRISLALEIWESLGDARPPAALTAEQHAELASRNAELDANPGLALTWEQIRASVETKP